MRRFVGILLAILVGIVLAIPSGRDADAGDICPAQACPLSEATIGLGDPKKITSAYDTWALVYFGGTTPYGYALGAWPTPAQGRRVRVYTMNEFAVPSTFVDSAGTTVLAFGPGFAWADLQWSSGAWRVVGWGGEAVPYP